MMQCPAIIVPLQNCQLFGWIASVIRLTTPSTRELAHTPKVPAIVIIVISGVVAATYKIELSHCNIKNSTSDKMHI